MDTDRNYDGYVETVYKILKACTLGMDSVYEDWIIHNIGTSGLNALVNNKYLETCGVINGRQLYVLCCEGES